MPGGGAGEQPLAARMRPRKLEDFIGQEHIVGPGRLLRRAIQADMLSSVIFSGPPGTGKTTLAMVIANTTKSRFVSLNAVLSGVKDIREAIEKARQTRELYGRRTILFVDEVHRWNKAQQDALLPWVENGTVILIGATTENPFFEVNSALVSRSRIFQLKTLSQNDLRRVARAALADAQRGYGSIDIDLDEDALEHLVSVADGDARSLLNALQLAVETTPEEFPPPSGHTIHITREIAEESIQRRAVLYDKEGDYHFDTISAFIKSLRGSDPDAALYWMARMIEGGEDPHYLFRRMLILASEDVGLADPHALGVVESAAAAFDRVGLPEGQFHLTQAALYLATTKKSNSTLGYFDALQAVRDERPNQVPRHLQDANRDAKGFGHGEGYLYPHAYRDHWVAQQYLPAGLQGRVFYQPSDQGHEARVREEVERRREVQLQAMTDDSEGGTAQTPGEILTYTPADRRVDAWLRRTSETVLADIRDAAFDALSLPRHATVVVCGNGIGFLVWEARRRTPEGQVYALFRRRDEYDTALHYADRLEPIQRPHLQVDADALLPTAGHSSAGAAPESAAGPATAGAADETGDLPDRFDAYLGRGLLYSAGAPATVLSTVAAALSPGGRSPAGRAVFIDPVPSQSTRLSDLLGGAATRAASGSGVDPDCLAFIRRAEEARAQGDDTRTRFDPSAAAATAREAGFAGASFRLHTSRQEVVMREETVRRWLDSLRARHHEQAVGSAGTTAADDGAWRRCSGSVVEYLRGRHVSWERVYSLLVCLL
ncbi:MAG: AAA family ATPase [bacterium]